MARDFSPIHPELRAPLKFMPQFTVNRWNLPIGRWLIKSMPAIKIPADIQVEQIHTKSQDGKYDLPLRVYKPRSTTCPLPVLLWIHGGGFIGGSMEMDDANLFGFVQELGIVVVSVDYRLAPEHPFPVPLDDCYTALKWICDHAAELGIDPTRIAVGGASAGGGLAATLAQLAHDRNEVAVGFQLLVYPMLDDRTVLKANVTNSTLLTWNEKSNRFGWESYLQQQCGSEKVPPYAVASRREDLTGLPPAWIGVGTIDLFHDEDKVYAERLKQRGVACELVVVPGAFHGFDTLGNDIPVTRDFRRSKIEALRRHLFS